MHSNNITIHGYPMTGAIKARLGSLWNGPVCYVCGQGYLGVHECDLTPIPCPDGREGCLVAHYGHKPKKEATVQVPAPIVYPSPNYSGKA